MHHPSWDDLDPFLETDDFAVTAQLHSETSGRVHQCTIVFDATYIDADIGDYRMNAPEPCFTCKETDVMHFKKHDYARIQNRHYRLTHDPQPDGTGMALVRLAPMAPP
ncbi:head-tail joining protein [Xylella fastidiosa subsp. multiplex]